MPYEDTTLPVGTGDPDEIEIDDLPLLRMPRMPKSVQRLTPMTTELDTLRARVAVLNQVNLSLEDEVKNYQTVQAGDYALLQEWKRRAEAAEALAESRLAVLNEKADEARREWQRAENAEAERDALNERLRAVRELAKTLDGAARELKRHGNDYADGRASGYLDAAAELRRAMEGEK